MNTSYRWITGTAAAAALIALAGCGGKSDTASARQAGAPADTALLAAADLATVARHDLSSGVPVSGTLAPGWQARVTSPLDDVLQDVLVREGQRVTKGQVLGHFRLGSVQADAASAHAQLRSATSDRERQKNLLAEGAVSERDVETAEAAFRAAQALDELASRRLADATLRAPGAGVITSRSVQTGDRVGKGDPLFVVADTRTLEFEATVPSEFIQHVKVGAPVALTASGYTGGTIGGHVARISNTADDATRQVKVYATVPNADGRLVGDLYASGSIVVKQAAHVICVPAASVRSDGSASIVWVLGADGRLAKRTIKPGLRDESHDLVEVLQGIAEGDRVLIGPAEGLSPGQPARVTGKEI
jgi:RND family efflux transporter MFP subunit